MKLKLLLFALSLFAVLSLFSQNVSAASCTQDADCSGCEACRLTGFLGLGGKKCVPLPNEAQKASFPHVWTDPCEEIYKKFCYQSTGSSSVDVWSGQQECPYTYSYKSCGGWEKLMQKCSAPTPKCYESGTSASCVECLENADCKDPAKPDCDTSTHTCKAKEIVCKNPSSYSNENNCQGAGCFWCGPPTFKGYCEYSLDKCTASCTYTASGTDAAKKNDDACTDACEYNGCNLRKMACQTGGVCGYSGTATYCGQYSKGCAGLSYCDTEKDYSKGCGSAGGCAWLTSFTDSNGNKVCSSGCPPSYPNQKYVCCDTIGYSQCNSRPACASYDPTKGETPCCTSSGYATCTKQEECTPSGCKNICTDPSVPKDGEPYCSKCNSCQDGIKNCGEEETDKCSTEPCTITTTTEYTKWSPYYCRDVCRGDGATCVAVMGSDGRWYSRGCSEGWTGTCKCSKTTTDFNPKTCSDGFQNCAETGKDCGGKCITGKETDNSYLVTFDYTEPSELKSTKLYTDSNSWNCADGIDNDKDCLLDCADPDCSSSLACFDGAPPSAGFSAAPAPPCTLNPLTSWIDCSATISVSCSDAGSGCKSGSYGYKIYDSNPGACPSSKFSYTSGSSFVASGRKFACAYAEDNAGNAGISAPVEIRINKTFTITVDAKAYGEIEFSAGMKVDAYLCDSSQYYCNHDAQYLTKGSAVAGEDKRFRITLTNVLERGNKYKIGVVTEKGYAESEFTA